MTETLEALAAVICAVSTVIPETLELAETESTALSARSRPRCTAELLEQATDTKLRLPSMTAISLPLDAVMLTGREAVKVWAVSRPPLDTAIVPETSSASSWPPAEAPAYDNGPGTETLATTPDPLVPSASERTSVPKPSTDDLTFCRASALPSTWTEALSLALTWEWTTVPSPACMPVNGPVGNASRGTRFAASSVVRAIWQLAWKRVVTTAEPEMVTSELEHERLTVRDALRETLDWLAAVICAMSTVTPDTLDLAETEITAKLACSRPRCMAEALEQLMVTKPTEPLETKTLLPLDAVTRTG
mmetsp:Transcript_111807/g.311123  ORF Transcript_111807/g.311123 Transcript_111807/m.311123 type:complete len:305 (-) Transcript_111807:512-1426(-)